MFLFKKKKKYIHKHQENVKSWVRSSPAVLMKKKKKTKPNHKPSPQKTHPKAIKLGESTDRKNLPAIQTKSQPLSSVCSQKGGLST